MINRPSKRLLKNQKRIGGQYLEKVNMFFFVEETKNGEGKYNLCGGEGKYLEKDY